MNISLKKSAAFCYDICITPVIQEVEALAWAEATIGDVTLDDSKFDPPVWGEIPLGVTLLGALPEMVAGRQDAGVPGQLRNA